MTRRTGKRYQPLWGKVVTSLPIVTTCSNQEQRMARKCLLECRELVSRAKSSHEKPRYKQEKQKCAAGDLSVPRFGPADAWSTTLLPGNMSAVGARDDRPSVVKPRPIFLARPGQKSPRAQKVCHLTLKVTNRHLKDTNRSGVKL